MATNKVATVVLFDIGSAMKNLCDDSETFFKKSQWCLLRIIARKIFSTENDELAIVLFGSTETNNNLSIGDDIYQNICEFTPLRIPDWDMYEKVQKLEVTDVNNANWIECLVVGLDYMKEQTKGKRFKHNQVILLSNFEIELNYNKDRIEPVIDSMNSLGTKLIVIGLDLEEECKDKELDSQLTNSLELVVMFLDKLENGVSLSFIEAESDITYYEKKLKMGRFTKLNLTIGSQIHIPVRWIKLNLEPTRIRWYEKPATAREHQKLAESSRTRQWNSVKREEIQFVQNEQKVTKFGETEVVLSYADLEAMKRQTGPPCCTLLGVVRRERITRQMFIGKDIYLIVPEISPKAQRMFSSFIDGLIDADKYAIVRRITVNNGRIKLGVLIPVSDNQGKFFYFIQIPFAEYSIIVPETVLPEPNDSNVSRLFDKVIDEMTIPVKPKELPMKDPTFQLRCHILHLYETGQLKKDSPELPLPEFINNLCNPYPELKDKASIYLKELKDILPIQDDHQIINMTQEHRKKLIKDALENLNSQSDLVGEVKVENEVSLAEAETQEWSDELKEKYKDIIIPPLNIIKEKLLTSQYINEDEIVSSGEYQKQNVTEEPMMVDATSSSKSAKTLTASEQMSLEKQVISSFDQNTEEMFAAIKKNIDEQK